MSSSFSFPMELQHRDKNPFRLHNKNHYTRDHQTKRKHISTTHCACHQYPHALSASGSLSGTRWPSCHEQDPEKGYSSSEELNPDPSPAPRL